MPSYFIVYLCLAYIQCVTRGVNAGRGCRVSQHSINSQECQHFSLTPHSTDHSVQTLSKLQNLDNELTFKQTTTTQGQGQKRQESGSSSRVQGSEASTQPAQPHASFSSTIPPAPITPTTNKKGLYVLTWYLVLTWKSGTESVPEIQDRSRDRIYPGNPG